MPRPRERLTLPWPLAGLKNVAVSPVLQGGACSFRCGEVSHYSILKFFSRVFLPRSNALSPIQVRGGKQTGALSEDAKIRFRCLRGEGASEGCFRRNGPCSRNSRAPDADMNRPSMKTKS